MADATKDRNVPHRILDNIAIGVKADSILYKSVMVAIDATGYAVKAGDTAGLTVMGWNRNAVDNTGGSSGDVYANVEKSKPIMMNCSGADVTWLNKSVYVVDDQTVGLIGSVTNNVYAGKVVEITSATQVYVLLAEEFGAGTFSLNVDMTDISTAGSAYVVAPFDGRIEEITSVINGAITVADAEITTEIDGVAVTGGAITIAFTGSAAGTVDSTKPTALNIFSKGDVIEIISDGGSTDTARATFTITCEKV